MPNVDRLPKYKVEFLGKWSPDYRRPRVSKTPKEPKPPLQPSAQTLEIVHLLQTTDWPYDTIAEQFKISRQRVGQIAKKNGIRRKK